MDSKILTIHLVKTGFPTDTCNYTLSIEGEFDKTEMEKIGVSKTGQGAVRVN